MNLVIKSLVGEMSDKRSVGMGKGKGSWRLFVVRFFILSIYKTGVINNIIFFQIWESYTENIYKNAYSCMVMAIMRK